MASLLVFRYPIHLESLLVDCASPDDFPLRGWRDITEFG